MNRGLVFTRPRSTPDTNTVDIFYEITTPSGRLAVNIYELMGIEETKAEMESGKPPVPVVRLYLRNGASFMVQDPDRDLVDKIQNKLRGYGDANEEQYADS